MSLRRMTSKRSRLVWNRYPSMIPLMIMKVGVATMPIPSLMA